MLGIFGDTVAVGFPILAVGRALVNCCIGLDVKLVDRDRLAKRESGTAGLVDRRGNIDPECPFLAYATGSFKISPVSSSTSWSITDFPVTRGRSLTEFPMGDCGENKELKREPPSGAGNSTFGVVPLAVVIFSRLWKAPLKRDV